MSNSIKTYVEAKSLKVYFIINYRFKRFQVYTGMQFVKSSLPIISHPRYLLYLRDAHCPRKEYNKLAIDHLLFDSYIRLQTDCERRKQVPKLHLSHF